MATETPNPIEALRRAMRYAHSGWPHGQAFGGCASKLCADAREALAQVEAAVAALGKAQNMPLLMKTWEKSSRDAAYDKIQAALAPFVAKEGS